MYKYTICCGMSRTPQSCTMTVYLLRFYEEFIDYVNKKLSQRDNDMELSVEAYVWSDDQTVSLSCDKCS